jgi:hypothetical protein
MINFNHSSTGWVLEGNHNQKKCTDCHSTDKIKDAPTECKECHAEPNLHRGQFTQSCDTCHTPQGWSPAKLDEQPFAHLTTTGFSLALHQTDYSNQAITCISCHPSDMKILDIQTCINCHTQHDTQFMSDHQQQYGSECLTCHDGVDRLSNFDHNTFFPLEAKHASIQCDACHADKAFRGTPSECYQCHQEPDIHAGVFGFKCYYCHTADAWSPATLQQHNFPLNHGADDQNAQLQCDTCHGLNYIDYTCYNCHDHQPDEIAHSHQSLTLPEPELATCSNCHPSGKVETQQTSP